MEYYPLIEGLYFNYSQTCKLWLETKYEHFLQHVPISHVKLVFLIIKQKPIE